MVRPYILKFKQKTSSSPVQNNVGDFSQTSNTPVEREFSCGVQPSGQGNIVISEDGISVNYSWIFYANKDVPKIPYGTPVEVFEGQNLIAKGTVKFYAKSRINVRIWV